MTHQPAAPRVDPDSAPFWKGLEHGAVMVQRCSECGTCCLPMLPTCPSCASREITFVEVAGVGSVYSWIVVHRSPMPAFAAELPYTIVTVDLDAGCRCFGRLDGVTQACAGLRVAPVFHRHETWTELRFCAADVGEPV